MFGRCFGGVAADIDGAILQSLPLDVFIEPIDGLALQIDVDVESIRRALLLRLHVTVGERRLLLRLPMRASELDVAFGTRRNDADQKQQQREWHAPMHERILRITIVKFEGSLAHAKMWQKWCD